MSTLQNSAVDVTDYILLVTFGFIILPENSPFSHPGMLKASLQDIGMWIVKLWWLSTVFVTCSRFVFVSVLPTVTGTCDQDHFYITVTYGSQGHNFETVVGQRKLSPDIAEEYRYTQNDTQFSIAVHFLAPDAAFEVCHSPYCLLNPAIIGRVWTNIDFLNRWFGHLHSEVGWILFWGILFMIGVLLISPYPAASPWIWLVCILVSQTLTPNWKWSSSALFLSIAECFSNGTMTALAVKVESVPDLDMSQLTLKDSQCKPAYSDHIFALFSFGVNSCGTTRKVLVV